MNFFFRPVAVALALSLGAAGCVNGQVDIPTVIADAKIACGIAVAADSVLAVLNAGIGLTVQGVVNLICGAFQAQQATAPMSKSAPPGTVIHFPVIVNGKTIVVTATTT